jgi:hypothetical protein
MISCLHTRARIKYIRTYTDVESAGKLTHHEGRVAADVVLVGKLLLDSAVNLQHVNVRITACAISKASPKQKKKTYIPPRKPRNAAVHHPYANTTKKRVSASISEGESVGDHLADLGVGDLGVNLRADVL